MFQPLNIPIINILLIDKKKQCVIKTFVGKVLYRGKEKKLEERRRAGAEIHYML